MPTLSQSQHRDGEIQYALGLLRLVKLKEGYNVWK